MRLSESANTHSTPTSPSSANNTHSSSNTINNNALSSLSPILGPALGLAGRDSVQSFNSNLDLSLLTKSDVPPRLTVHDPTSYNEMTWKNGLGVTREICIHPNNRDFHKDEFVWRLSLIEVHDSCSFSVFPGYDIALMGLPPHGLSTLQGPFSASAMLHHNDQETPVTIKPLVPYTYAGELPTTCFVKSQKFSHLTLIANRAACHVSRC
jgi:hypothetical protein